MPSDLSHIARSCWCLALIQCCKPHIELQKAEDNHDFTPWDKLLTKLNSWVSGELKSAQNLERFYQEFLTWQENYEAADSLNGRITDLCIAATSAAMDMLNDPDCDDLPLIRDTIGDLYSELDQLGGDAEGLSSYAADVFSEWESTLREVSQRPVSRTTLRQISETEVSLFGLSS
jgi:hypothetical protein